ncbi:hypothetical protein VTI74DRAFT_650 [Chaetomium olivicolor]
MMMSLYIFLVPLLCARVEVGEVERVFTYWRRTGPANLRPRVRGGNFIYRRLSPVPRALWPPQKTAFEGRLPKLDSECPSDPTCRLAPRWAALRRGTRWRPGHTLAAQTTTGHPRTLAAPWPRPASLGRTLLPVAEACPFQSA